MWLLESNRMQHLAVGIVTALTLTILSTIGAAFAAEYKDKAHGGLFDWLDIAATMIGGVIGQLIQIGIILLIL